MRFAPALACILLAACATARPPAARSPTSVVGPAAGTLFIAGGGVLDESLVARFVRLAGGDTARIVIIPTAATGDSFPESWSGMDMFRAAGVRDLRVLHTRSRATADSEAFVAPLQRATAVWLSGGRQWRLADSYLDTRTLREIRALLERGGTVGGTSAGASIQASYMVRGAAESNEIVMAPGRETGFGLIASSAIDQHLTARGRQDDLLEVVRRHPDLLGIGIDEGTALIVRGDRAEIVGRGRVAFYNTADRADRPYYFLSAGDTFDLARRIALAGTPVSPQTVRDEIEVLAAMTRLFDAMRVRDTASIRAMSHPDLRIFVSSSGVETIRVTSLDSFVAGVGTATERLDERPADPEVRVDGRLATVWTFYDFVIGSNFSHCGRDSFQFIKERDAWIMVGLAYTVRRDACSR
jgi:cyanophycinase